LTPSRITERPPAGGLLFSPLKIPFSVPILEINPTRLVVQHRKGEEKHFDDWAAVLFDQA
jgi:hypothetical protein